MAHNNQSSAAAETNERKDSLDHALIWMEMTRNLKNERGEPVVDYELGIVYNETGVAYGMNEQWDLAAEYFIKSMDTMKAQDNYEDTMLGWPEPNLGLIYWIQGRYEDANNALQEILEIHDINYGVRGEDDTESFK